MNKWLLLVAPVACGMQSSLRLDEDDAATKEHSVNVDPPMNKDQLDDLLFTGKKLPAQLAHVGGVLKTEILRKPSQSEDLSPALADIEKNGEVLTGFELKDVGFTYRLPTKDESSENDIHSGFDQLKDWIPDKFHNDRVPDKFPSDLTIKFANKETFTIEQGTTLQSIGETSVKEINNWLQAQAGPKKPSLGKVA